ncbi:MAG: Slp family lipoprotein [Nitrospirales bacterium]|nr:Slp family lipoprotein [Nitrospira sp.]MDR4501804.1 Slp family lipoprotein [Nitrospirales bacterium]
MITQADTWRPRLTYTLRHHNWWLSLLVCLLLTACSFTPRSIVPQTLEGQINHEISFLQIKESPDTHAGTLILVGGEVLSAKRLKDHTRLTVLELPLSSDQEPTTDRTLSQGRFIARQTAFLDPATVPPGTRVTLVGKVTGSHTELLDEMEYTYPTLSIEYLKVWEDADDLGYRYRPYAPPPFWGGPYWGYYGGFYRPYPYWYW